MLYRLFSKKNDTALPPQLLSFLRSLGIKPKDKALYLQAFRHRSQSIKLSNGVQNSNERLEYLGDAVI
jgi:ribonuclease-3